VKRNDGSARHLIFLLLALSLICAPLAHARAKAAPTNSRDPYVTAEYEVAPAVKADDLAYRVILFEDFTVPAEWEADARPLVTATENRAISRLIGTNAFTTVASKQNQSPEDPYLVVKCTLLNYRIVSTAARFWGGVIAGTSYIAYRAQVYDGKSGALLFQREVSTQNSAWAATWSSSDVKLPTFLGNVLGDYLALRARKDKGVDVLPLELSPPPQTETGTPR
jgi:hypothetical protein